MDGDVSIHIESLVLEGTPEPDAVAAALAAQVGDRLSPEVLAHVSRAVVASLSGTDTDPRRST